MPGAAYDGLRPAALAARLGVPLLEAHAALASTQDRAHALAEAGAPHGTVVVADAQTGGRGRAGRRWASPPGAGVWATVVTRPRAADALELLALRAGLALAEALEPLAGVPLGVKWPNDVLLAGAKLAGVLVEARWRDGRPEWAAVGVGVNVVAPAPFPGAATLPPGASRLDTLAAVVRAALGAAAGAGHLTADELARLAGRDAVRGRPVLGPIAGVADGVTAAGSLRVRDGDGAVHTLRDAGVTFGAA